MQVGCDLDHSIFQLNGKVTTPPLFVYKSASRTWSASLSSHEGTNLSQDKLSRILAGMGAPGFDGCSEGGSACRGVSDLVTSLAKNKRR